MDFSADFLRFLAIEDAVLVTIESTQGSAPRASGTWMAVFAKDLVGTIGGGHVEFEAIATARQRLANPQVTTEPYSQRYVLGPSLGQCCGGVMTLRYQKVSISGSKYAGKVHNWALDPTLAAILHPALQPVALFGGGHVGKALVRVFSTLPMQVTWIDSRDEIFPAELPTNVVCEHSDPVQAAVNDLAAGSHVLIMSFSHAEDLDIVAACLQRQREKADLPFTGLIGSKTKWATFRHRLEARGFTEAELAHITCPIGLDCIAGKEPEVIAVSAAAQLLQLRIFTPYIGL
ncbi:MAG: xanthine dehydrogenase accessory protein XdhC [Burkholderiaceae bacterium]|nr:xanthine dehydrogenase accessory protein XdhC [Burkholderiaceae bacterium]